MTDFDDKSPWTKGINTLSKNIKCVFTEQQAIENSYFLKDLFQEKWLLKGIASPGKDPDSLFRLWNLSTLHSFLSLNSLAEDLRVLADVEGFNFLIDDLKKPKFFMPTRHTIHTAALFARAKDQKIIQFFETVSDTKPDFHFLSRQNQEIVVECKLSIKSDVELAFESYAESLTEAVQSQVFKDKQIYPPITVLIKDYEKKPSIEAIVEVSNFGIENFRDKDSTFRSKDFNLKIGFKTPPPNGLSYYKGCEIICARSEKENLRIQTRSNKAGSQLRPFIEQGIPGILSLGLNDSQEPRSILSILNKRFLNNHYTSISSAIVIRPDTFLYNGECGVVDLMGMVINPNAKKIINSDIGFAAIENYKLVGSLPKDEISTYWHAKFDGSGRGSDWIMPFPNRIQTISRDELL